MINENSETSRVFDSSDCGLVTDLKRNAKAKEFFQGQLSCREEDIFIPRWFHATRQERADTPGSGYGALLRSGLISNEAQSGGFWGAWVSTVMETAYGPMGIAMSEKVQTLDDKPNIQTTHGDRTRWRGIGGTDAIEGKPIDLTRMKVMLWVPNSPQDKPAQKIAKTEAVKALTEGRRLPYTALAVTAEQMSYMQSLGQTILGTPNLSWHWWAKRS